MDPSDPFNYSPDAAYALLLSAGEAAQFEQYCAAPGADAYGFPGACAAGNQRRAQPQCVADNERRTWGRAGWWLAAQLLSRTLGWTQPTAVACLSHGPVVCLPTPARPRPDL